MLTLSIQSAIRQGNGFLPFSEFMQQVLYKPGYGYYTGTHCPVGERGDFITAPMMGVLFSRCLANQCAEILKNLDQGIILECGAGSGDMAAEILLSLERMDCLPQQYWILELGAGLKIQQEQTLRSRCPHLLNRVLWLDSLPSTPFEGVIVGNEVLDALPLTLFQFDSDQQILERGVGLDSNGQFIWTERSASDALVESVRNLHKQYGPWPLHYQSELSLFFKPWLASLAQILKHGAMIWIDYGGRGQELYHASRLSGSLRCYEAHHLCDSPLENLGRRDITADVNFTAVGQAALDLNLNCVGYIDQSLFLMNCQLDELIQQALAESPESILKIQAQARQLVHPVGGGMGERFKVMALTQGYDKPLLGFSRGNRVIYL